MKNLMNVLLMCFLFTGAAMACPPDGSTGKSTNIEKSVDGAMQVTLANLELNVKGMTCAGCENKVKAALSGIDGVVETKKVCSESDRASLTYDPKVVSEDDIIKVLTEKTGYAISVDKSAGMTGEKKECSKTCTKTCCANKEGAAKSCAKAKSETDKKMEDLEKE